MSQTEVCGYKTQNITLPLKKRGRNRWWGKNGGGRGTINRER
jgi:hypothetical protein